MKKRKDDENKKSIVESFFGDMPIFGNLIKELAKTEAFKERFKDVDEQIKENLRTGGQKKWGFQANISIRPIIGEEKKETSEIFIGEDYYISEKANKLTLMIKAPKDANLVIAGKNLLIKSDNFERKLELPGFFRNITKKQYDKGILTLEMTK